MPVDDIKHIVYTFVYTFLCYVQNLSVNKVTLCESVIPSGVLVCNRVGGEIIAS